MVATTWDPATITGGMTLSNVNLTGSISAVGGDNFAYSTVTGTKFYYEAVVNLLGSSFAAGIGGTDSGFAAAAFLGADAHSFSFYDSALYLGGAPGGVSVPTYVQGDTVSIAVDVANLAVWVRVNGGAWSGGGSANPATNVGGASISTMSGPIKATIDLRNSVSSQVTAKFSSASWTYAAPSGFISLDGAGAVAVGRRNLTTLGTRIGARQLRVS